MRRCFRRIVPFALALLITAGAEGATVSSTFTLTNASVTVNSSGNYTISGQATLSNVYTGNGTFATTTFSVSGATATPNFTITVSPGNTLTGTFTFAITALAGNGTGSLSITGGTGSYAGYTGSFPSVSETGSFSGLAITLNCSGTGTVNTSGGGTTTPTPTIAGVVDAASYSTKIAQGSLFDVFGTNLSPSTQGLTSFPWPTNSNGVKVTFTPTAGGAGTDTYLNYVGTGQINALLPSTVPVGNYNVTVTSGTTTSPTFSAQVVASKLGLFTQDQSGTGLAVVQNYISPSEVDVNRLTTGTYNGSLSSPAKPGQVLIAWGTGIGPWQPADNQVGIVHDFRGSLTIAAVVGGVSIPVDFAGRAGYAGVDQINFTLPGNVPTGCAVTLQISVNGVLSAPTSIAIAPTPSATACVHPSYTTQQLQDFDQGKTITTGGFLIEQFAETVPGYGTGQFDIIGGSFAQITGYQLAAASTLTSNVTTSTSGSCQVVHITTKGTATGTAGHLTYLDAGTVTLTGPSGSSLTNQKLTEDASYIYSYSILEGITIPGLNSNGKIVPGTYTLAGAGGNDVGSFNTSITIGSPLTLNPGLPATVTESAGLTLNWQGGNASDIVEIVGSSGTSSGTGANLVTDTTEFICTTTAGQKTFTVPASVLTQLPTITAAQVSAGTASGFLEVASGATPSNFSATLKKDGSNIPGIFMSFVGTGSSVLYQ